MNNESEAQAIQLHCAEKTIGHPALSATPPFSEGVMRVLAKIRKHVPPTQGALKSLSESGQAYSPNSGQIEINSVESSAEAAPSQQLSVGTSTDIHPEPNGISQKPANGMAHIEDLDRHEETNENDQHLSADVPDFSKGAPEKFPVTVFPTDIQKVVKELARVYQAPICVPAMSAVAALSAAVGKCTVVTGAVQDLVTRLNLFVVMIAERGTCKSIIGGKIVDPINKYSTELADDHSKTVARNMAELAVLRKEAAKLELQASKLDLQAGKVSDKARDDVISRLAQKIQRITELEKAASRQATAIESDITGEAMVLSLEANHETLFSYSPEAGAVVSVTAGKYKDGRTDLDPYLSGYSGDPLRVTRIGRPPLVVLNPCLSALWMMQGIVAHDLISNRDTMPRGFTARVLLFDSGARRQFDSRENGSFSTVGIWNKILSLLLLNRKIHLNKPPKEIACAEEARQEFTDFFDEGVRLERDWCPDLQGEFSRQRENAIKIAGLFALVEGKNILDRELAKRAIEVVRWIGFNYLSLIQLERKERLKKDFDRVMAVLTDNRGVLGLGRLAQYHAITREKINALMAVYPGDFIIKKTPQPQGKPGRPAEVLVAPSAVRSAEARGNKIEKIEKLSGGSAAA
jgi:hypothetical protein